MDRSAALKASKCHSETSLLSPRSMNKSAPRFTRHSYISPHRKSAESCQRRSFILKSLNDKLLDALPEGKGKDCSQGISKAKAIFCESDSESVSTADMTEEPLEISLSSIDASESSIRRSSILIPLTPSQFPQQRKSAVKFADWAELSLVEDLNATTDYEDLYYNADEIADFRHAAFLEECGLDDF
eukprot:scaffold747_cov120-Cylindrotheca_fusiformis.AAC.15